MWGRVQPIKDTVTLVTRELHRGFVRVEVAKNVTELSLYIKLLHLTRNHHSLIGDNYWTVPRPFHMITSSKTNNHRDKEMTYYIIKEKNNALFGDCYFGGEHGYTTDKNDADRFETKEEAKSLLTGYFTEEELKSVKIVKVKD